jgi:hypothetical protein
VANTDSSEVGLGALLTPDNRAGRAAGGVALQRSLPAPGPRSWSRWLCAAARDLFLVTRLKAIVVPFQPTTRPSMSERICTW